MRRLQLERATECDRQEIYRIRHDVYATELGQHPPNAAGRLTDRLDSANEYLVARDSGELAGFVSITPPGIGVYSFDKYLDRDEIPFEVDEDLFEIRILTVREPFRGRAIAALLMWAALRWVQDNGGTHIAAIGRREVLSIYERAGLTRQGRTIRCGAVEFELLHTETAGLADSVSPRLLDKLARSVDWRLDFPFKRRSPCMHGGAFFEGIGDRFDDLNRRRGIINADVLDAWFPPAPGVIDALSMHLPWITATSPPTDASGLTHEIARARRIPETSILAGSGSSSLIFLAFREWMSSRSRALIIDPTYGEYAHVLENVIGCRVDRFPLKWSEGFRLDVGRWVDAAAKGYDLVVLVNPNNPTGCAVPRGALESGIESLPRSVRVWVDESYIEYAGKQQSLEPYAADSENVVVCKSMSKMYALSGLRVGYLCGPKSLLESLRVVTPPWAVSLPAQIAAVKALQDPDYYRGRYAATHDLRHGLLQNLSTHGFTEVSQSRINSLLLKLPDSAPSAAEVVSRCRPLGLFLRDGASIAPILGRRTIRLAVKDRESNQRAFDILGTAIY